MKGQDREQREFSCTFFLFLVSCFPLHSVLHLFLFLCIPSLYALVFFQKKFLSSNFISFFFPALAFFPLLVPPSQMIFLISGWFGHEGVTEELGLTRSLAFWGFQLHLAGADLGLVQSEGVWGGVVPFPLAQGFRSSQARGGACCTPHLLPVVGNNAPLHLGLWLFCPLPLCWHPARLTLSTKVSGQVAAPWGGRCWHWLGYCP